MVVEFIRPAMLIFSLSSQLQPQYGQPPLAFGRINSALQV
ncbi:hypothetical protein MNBD_GAMMA13-1615 [hydrothermal vent metagenome]|uniref:Uncharacterized protein n=1 Tax=hydrothermal vent metagenome TaxID=652676 RepID=A0A3B0YNX4_9ZZZZ